MPQDALADVARLFLAVSSHWQNIPETRELYSESRQGGLEKFISCFI